MADLTQFNFVPTNGFRDASAYPDPPSEAYAREQLMSLHDQTKNYINLIADEVVSLGREVDSIAGATGSQAAINTITQALGEVKIWYFNATIANAAEDSSVYEGGYKKTYTTNEITDNTKAQIEFPNGEYAGNVTWQTNADHSIDLYFDLDPNGMNIRVSLMATFQVPGVVE